MQPERGASYFPVHRNVRGFFTRKGEAGWPILVSPRAVTPKNPWELSPGIPWLLHAIVLQSMKVHSCPITVAPNQSIGLN